MSHTNQNPLGNTIWKISDELREAMNVDDFRIKILFFLFFCDFYVQKDIHGNVAP
jgi:type I restriction-modification system DNA methylase subunit